VTEVQYGVAMPIRRYLRGSSRSMPRYSPTATSDSPIPPSTVLGR
jgi:hypothetical protein